MRIHRIFHRRASSHAAASPAAATALRAWAVDKALRAFVEKTVAQLKPERVMLCDGSAEERARLLREMELTGAMVRASPDWPNCWLARSPPSDVARVESRTFISSTRAEDAGPLNNWREPAELRATLSRLLDGAARGRTLYFLPFCMGPGVDSRFSLLGVQATDSPYAVCNMTIMSRCGPDVLARLNAGARFVPGVHSVGAPLAPGEQDVPWPQNSSDKIIAHFPESREIVSYGSGYGGNALLGKKCLALRIASAIGRDEGWLAEHMLILSLTHKATGVTKYVLGAMPSACGKTNLAMLVPALEGYKVEVVGDDIAWLRLGEDGRLWAVNPETGFFGVAPGTNAKTNQMALRAASSNAIFTNVASTLGGAPWWEGLSPPPEGGLISWLKRPWSPGDGSGPAAHANSRFTAPASQCPSLSPRWQDAGGVPVSAILFGGRRGDTVPLVLEAESWEHGVYMGATLSSETTAAAEGALGNLRFDPMAMRPFIGYDVQRYLGHWLSFGARTAPHRLPKIFSVNWYQKGADGKFLWPGFGENSRVLDWIFRRCADDAAARPAAVQTPAGLVPPADGLDTAGLAGVTPATMRALLSVDAATWTREMARHRTFLDSLGGRLPPAIEAEHARIGARVRAAAQK